MHLTIITRCPHCHYYQWHQENGNPEQGWPASLRCQSCGKRVLHTYFDVYFTNGNTPVIASLLRTYKARRSLARKTRQIEMLTVLSYPPEPRVAEVAILPTLPPVEEILLTLHDTNKESDTLVVPEIPLPPRPKIKLLSKAEMAAKKRSAPKPRKFSRARWDKQIDLF